MKPEDDKIYNVVLGKTLIGDTNNDDEQYNTVTYNVKPPSIDTTRSGYLKSAQGQVTIQFHHNTNVNETINYEGNLKASSNLEHVLIFEDGQFRLEQLSNTARLTLVRRIGSMPLTHDSYNNNNSSGSNETASPQSNIKKKMDYEEILPSNTNNNNSKRQKAGINNNIVEQMGAKGVNSDTDTPTSPVTTSGRGRGRGRGRPPLNPPSSSTINTVTPQKTRGKKSGRGRGRPPNQHLSPPPPPIPSSLHSDDDENSHVEDEDDDMDDLVAGIESRPTNNTNYNNYNNNNNNNNSLTQSNNNNNNQNNINNQNSQNDASMDDLDFDEVPIRNSLSDLLMTPSRREDYEMESFLNQNVTPAPTFVNPPSIVHSNQNNNNKSQPSTASKPQPNQYAQKQLPPGVIPSSDSSDSSYSSDSDSESSTSDSGSYDE